MLRASTVPAQGETRHNIYTHIPHKLYTTYTDGEMLYHLSEVYIDTSTTSMLH
jgi:hypothetical protein